MKRAAPTRATVLILGESGTGKELIAQALHEESPRSDKPFIKVNCAALSETLLESELFGHEKGAFTGASAARRGASSSPTAAPCSSTRSATSRPRCRSSCCACSSRRSSSASAGRRPSRWTRLVAATNRDLAAEVKAAKFREDLYYRLNVVAVTLPPLRQRKGDIPALVSHFIDKYAKAYGKEIRGPRAGDAERAPFARLAGQRARARERRGARRRPLQELELTADDLPPRCAGRGRGNDRRARYPSPAPPSTRSSARPSCGRWRWSAARRRARPRSSASACARSSTA